MDVTQETVILILAAIIAWAITKMTEIISRAVFDFKFASQGKAHEYQRVYEMAVQYGEQLLEKHAIDKSNIENIVLDWSNKYMLEIGTPPPAREVAIGLIRAAVRQYNQAHKENGVR